MGAPKSGTTAMNHYLGLHPQIFMAEQKESHFFATDLIRSFPRDPQEFEAAYLALFSRAGNQTRLGEASVLYLYSPLAPRRIKAFNPRARAVAMLRNPVDMMYSHHSQLLYNVDEDLVDFREALEAEGARKQGLRIPPSCHTRDLLFYREIADYPSQLERYFEILGRENIHVILFDDFQSRTAEVYADTLRFLGVDPAFRPEFQVINANKQVRLPALRTFLKKPHPLKEPFKKLLPERWRYRLIHGAYRLNSRRATRPPMDPALREELSREFRPVVKRLSDLLQRDLSAW